MPLKAGIVGLPNVGKSTLFNAVTSAQALVANYPFATIEPNVGTVYVPDERLPRVAELIGSKKAVPTAIEIIDIAGLVKGASQGEGLGNRFLSHIRDVDAIVQDVATRGQARVALENRRFLAADGRLLLAVKARSEDVTRDPADVFDDVRGELEEGYELLETQRLDEYHTDHLGIVARPR